MNSINGTRNSLLAVFLLLTIIAPASATNYKAFSLKTAEQLLQRSMQETEVRALGGISKVVGVVYDEPRGDVVLVGEEGTGEQVAGIDELVTALRAVLKHDRSPEVSIDRTTETERTDKQIVRFEGGIDNTRFGKYLLEADIVLKKLGLGKIRAEVYGVRSYFDMCADDWRESGQEQALQSRFWFKPDKERSYAASRPGVGIIKALKIKVETEVTGLPEEERGDDEVVRMRDEIGERFASDMTAILEEISDYYAEIGRLDALFRLTGVAEVLKKWNTKNGIDLSCVEFWLEQYPVRTCRTPETYNLISSEASRGQEGNNRKMVISGGIELRNFVRDIKDGSLTAFKDLVIKSRPTDDALTWQVPLGYAWDDSEILDDTEVNTHETTTKLSSCGALGTTLRRQFQDATASPNPHRQWDVVKGTLRSREAMFSFSDRLVRQPRSYNVGGVMLDGVAKVPDVENANIDLTTGNFSLVADGKGARIAPETFRKFVTALWAVYYSNQDPGISIDPIAPGVDKHMVRYIGNVINTDLGRVMREADYLMKKWSVGTERPDIRDFRNPDEISGRRGYTYLAASRFWFVPEDMRFRRAGNMLLFDDGRMTVKTEYLLADRFKTRADPSNEQFAQFLTDNYTQLAEKYPVLAELFEYAKLVSLSKYMKENGVPLYWFLMANKDLVLTEDSPGTVEAMAKGSDYFKNIRIEGGVDLGVKENYVFDSQAMETIRNALSEYGSVSRPTTTAPYRIREISSVERSFSFDLDGRSYSVVPQHSLTSGKDHRGIRYQTDIALRARGFKLNEQSLEALKHDVIYRTFAEKWNRLVDTLSESQLEQEGKKLYRDTWDESEKKVANDIDRLKSLIGKKFDSEDTFTKAVQTALGQNNDATLIALAKKHAYYQTDLEVVRFFNPKQTTQGQFGQGWHLLIPYRIKPFDTVKRDFLNVRIPEKMAVENLISCKKEVLTFSTERYTAAGYVPEKIESSQLVGLFIMTDASYRLVDKLGNEFYFDKAGYLTDMLFSRNHHIKIEYLDPSDDVFEQSPCQIQPAGQERIQVLNASLPKVMVVKDLLNGCSEEFVFAKEISAYIPNKGIESRFEVLNIMLDASFRLHDKQGNVIAFGSDGRFASFAVSPDSRMVKSISAGPYKVDFNYTGGSFGRVLIAGAQLLEDGESKPLYAVKYDYDQEDKLSKAIRLEVHVTTNTECAQTEMLVASRRGGKFLYSQ